ncbi:MAG: 50S ribosomal protein L10 [Acidimicrobiia bacterium]
MARPEKVAVVEEIRTKVAESDATVLTEYRGLKVHELAELRAALRPSGTEYKVFKNTLARRAMDAPELGDVVSLLEGPVAIAFVKGDPAGAAKALRDFQKINPALVLKGGVLSGKVIAPTEIDALAELPSREVLLAQIAGAFQAPLVKAAGLFQALPRNLAYGVKALIDQRVAAGADAPESSAPAEPEAEALAAEAPTDEAPADEAPADEAPADEAAAEEAPTEAPAEESTQSESE